MQAIETVTSDKVNHCPDLGGKATTRKVTDAVIAALQNDSDGVPEQNPEDAPEKSFAPLR
jgi:hypothetical protein